VNGGWAGIFAKLLRCSQDKMNYIGVKFRTMDSKKAIGPIIATAKRVVKAIKRGFS
jgi:hypothetical protein